MVQLRNKGNRQAVNLERDLKNGPGGCEKTRGPKELGKGRRLGDSTGLSLALSGNDDRSCGSGDGVTPIMAQTPLLTGNVR
jgi:hypothetical protein